jgi:hypothetical protein
MGNGPKRVITGITIRLSFVLGAVFSGGAALAEGPLGPDTPCTTREIQDTQMALFEPDRYAWELFKELNAPASLWAKCPNRKKPLGAPGPVVWETWRNIAPAASRSVFPPRATHPGPWRKYAPDKFEIASISGLTSTPIVRSLSDLIAPIKVRRNTRNKFDLSKVRQLEKFAVSTNANIDRAGTEIRMNREAYLFVRDNELYNRDVLTKIARSGTIKNLDLPAAAKEIKAQWQEIKEEDKPNFHWVTFENEDGTLQTWGLTALHITTKDTPNWFWATFEHITTSQDWINPNVDAYACPDSPLNCDTVPREIKGTKWENYRLRGTQISFVDSRGEPTRLANGQIEAGIQEKSSCITCHAEAAMDAEGEHRIPSSPYLGIPKTDKLEGLMQLDFMFAFERASSPSDPE